MNTLETYVLQYIGENTDSPDVFVDTDEGLEPIRESLNDAIEEISFLTSSYKKTYQIFLVPDQIFYRIKLKRGELAWITDAWLVGHKERLVQSDVLSLTSKNPRWLNHSGNPYYYVPIGSNIIGFVPAPSGEDMVELNMVITPERMQTSTDRIRVREAFKWAAVYYAVGEFFASRGNAGEALTWHQKYLEELGLMNLYPKYQEKNYQFGNKSQNVIP
ncbi:MAG: hypothetical protein PHE50_00225 [Dehalococcoidales bacterium]|nr:hypothetical protein [Dehalococcoidales bacterium]